MLLFSLKVKSAVGGEARMLQSAEERNYVVPFKLLLLLSVHGG